MEEITQIATSLGELVNDLGMKMAARGAEAQMLNESVATGSAARMLKLTRNMAADMTAFSDSVDARLPNFHQAWENFERDFTNVLFTVNIESSEDREAALDLVAQLEELRASLREAIEGLEEARGQFETLRGASAALSAAVRRLGAALDGLYKEFSTGESVLIRTINLLDQKIQSS